MKTIQLYTDGACSGNPGRGGWAAIAIHNGDNIMVHHSGYRLTTNNRMEILAVVQGLKDLSEQFSSKETDIKVTVYSDSQLVVNTMTQGWTRKTNADLWEKLDEAVALFAEVEFVKVKGHADDRMNAYADEVAVEASQPQNALNVDTVYEQIHGGFNTTVVGDEPEVTNMELRNVNDKQHREVLVTLSNGTVITIVGYAGGFEQFGGTTREFRITLPLAWKFAGWLNGKKF